jgi:phosphohistidine phosphatase
MIALHLLRHAHAGDPMRWTADDASRPLSEKGIRQAERLGRLLASYDEAPDLFITSPKVRAAQTAEIVAKALRAEVVVDGRLAGGLDAGVVTDILLVHAAGSERPCIVGHDPDFSELLGELLGLGPVPMRKGAIARVDMGSRELVPGLGLLRYLLPPELIPGR